LAGIRSLRPDDIPQIGDLFASIFRPGQTVRRSAIEAALARTYLTSPGDLKRPSSLVDTNEDGRIQGFMGIITIAARFGDEYLRGGVLGNFMALEAGRAQTALRLSLATGKQDLDFVFTDTANRTSLDMARGFKYSLLPLNSLEWVKILRPVETLSFLLGRRLKGAEAVLAPIARFADQAASRLSFASLNEPERREIIDRPIDAAAFGARAPALIERFTIRPDWNPGELQWLLTQAAFKTRNGPLHIREVSDGAGKPLGLYLLYAKAGAAAQVLQIVSLRNHEATVLGSIFRTAFKLGAVAVRGPANAAAVEGLIRQTGIFYHHVAASQVFARRPDVKEAFLERHSCLGGLFGEAWTQLSTDDFL
jgi:hypothetical protein